MRNSVILFLAFTFILSSCTPASNVGEIQTSAVQTAFASLPTITPPASSTPKPTSTHFPTKTAPPPTAAPKAYAWNLILSQDSGGVIVTIDRIILMEKGKTSSFDTIDSFKKSKVLIGIILTVENKTNTKVMIYPNQGTVVVGSEQVNLRDFMFFNEMPNSEAISGTIFPGVKATGGFWLGLGRTPIEEVKSMTFNIMEPADGETYIALGPEFNFEIDLSERRNDPLSPRLNFLK